MSNCVFEVYKSNPLEFEGDPDHEVSGRISRTISDWAELGRRFDKDADRASKRPRKHFRHAHAEEIRDITKEGGR